MRIIIALGVAGLIVTQGTDLSAGRQVGLAAVVAATLLQSMENVNKVFRNGHDADHCGHRHCLCDRCDHRSGERHHHRVSQRDAIYQSGTMIIVYGINSPVLRFRGRLADFRL